MAASPFGAAFDKLCRDTQLGIIHILRQRRLRYTMAVKQRGYVGITKIVIIGDTPGPKRPDNPNYHHTPFYSTKNCSLWLNKQLVEAHVPEDSLLWFNAIHASGEPLNPIHIEDLKHLNPTYIVLGGNAEKWLKKASPETPYIKVYHPQFAKRFKSKEPYALIEEIKKAL